MKESSSRAACGSFHILRMQQGSTWRNISSYLCTFEHNPEIPELPHLGSNLKTCLTFCWGCRHSFCFSYTRIRCTWATAPAPHTPTDSTGPLNGQSGPQNSCWLQGKIPMTLSVSVRRAGYIIYTCDFPVFLVPCFSTQLPCSSLLSCLC